MLELATTAANVPTKKVNRVFSSFWPHLLKSDALTCQDVMSVEAKYGRIHMRLTS